VRGGPVYGGGPAGSGWLGGGGVPGAVPPDGGRRQARSSPPRRSSLTRIDVTLRAVDPYPVDEERDVVLPDQTRDDTDEGWGEENASNDDRLREDRPPHW